MDKEDTSLNVLLIEDSDTDAFIIQNAISRHHKDARCQRAATMHASEQILEKGGIDLVLLDLGLPDTASAQDTYEQIKKWTEKLPVIIMTNLKDHDLAKAMVHEGAADFLNKYLIAENPMHIQKAIDFAVERHAISKRLQQESKDKDAILNCFMGGYSVSGKQDDA
jgi:DNA-binding NtrC family response regulator